ncbi:MAG: hypothetical protein AB2672_13415 [Candidatus Thiodiazotropha endolucinida]
MTIIRAACKILKVTASWWLCASALALLVSCSNEVKNEKWIGYYKFEGNEIQFPLHLDIQIQDEKVKGLAFDGSMEKATVAGTVKDGFYELLLHPVKHGEKTNQDVHYRGKRTGDAIVGEWEHVVGVKGPWVSNITNNGPREAMEPYRIPCEDVKVSSREGCGNGA